MLSRFGLGLGGLTRTQGVGYVPPDGFDLYLAPSAAGASDSNPGTQAAPVRTHAGLRTLINALGAGVSKTFYAEGVEYVGQHLDLSSGTAGAGAVADITFGEGYILDGTGITNNAIQCGGATGWAMILRAENPAVRPIVRNFTNPSANGIGLHGANTMEVFDFEITGCEDGVSNHNTGGTLTTHSCYIHKCTRSQVIHAGGTSIHNDDIIEGLGAEPGNLMTTVAGCVTTFNNATVIPAGTFGTTTPLGAFCSLAGAVAINSGTWGSIGVKSLVVSAATNVTFNDAVVDLAFDGNNTLAFNDCAGHLTYRLRSGGGQTFRNCDFRGPATTRATTTFGTASTLLVDIATLGVSKLDMLDCSVTGYSATAIGQALDATEAAALVAVSGFQIKNVAFFANGTNIDADIVSADGGVNIANNITTDPLLSLTPGDEIGSWGYRPGSPCIGAGFGGGNIIFPTV